MTLLKMSFYGTVIILAILLIRVFTLHKLPKKAFLILWGVALLRLLVPFEISSGLSLYSLLPDNIEFADNTDVYVPDPANPYEPFQNYADYLKNQNETKQFNNDAVIVEQTGAAVYLPNENPDAEAVPLQIILSTIIPILPILWGIGALLCAAFFLVSYIKCYVEFRTSLPVTEEYAARWLKQHPLKRKIELRQSDKISAPLTYGIFHPVILMPKKTDWDNQAELEYVLYHEFTHIRRFDLLAKLIMLVAVCLHWFNPFVWMMYFFFNRDLELSCDDCVVKHFDESKAAYAHTLIGMEEKKNYDTPLCNHFSKNAIEERITAIMKSKKTTIGMIIAAILIVAAVIITLTTSGKKTIGTPENSNNNSGSINHPTDGTPTPTILPDMEKTDTSTVPLWLQVAIAAKEPLYGETIYTPVYDPESIEPHSLSHVNNAFEKEASKHLHALGLGEEHDITIQVCGQVGDLIVYSGEVSYAFDNTSPYFTIYLVYRGDELVKTHIEEQLIPLQNFSSQSDYPTFPAGEAVVTEKAWDLTFIDETELPRFSELASLEASQISGEPSDSINIGQFYTISLDGISYFFLVEDAPEDNDRAWHLAITSPDHPLSGGAKVGMTETELLALYPDLAKTAPDYDDPVFAAKYGPSMFNFRDDQFPKSFLQKYDYAYTAYLDKGRSGLPVCIAFLMKEEQIGAITVYMPTAG